MKIQLVKELMKVTFEKPLLRKSILIKMTHFTLTNTTFQGAAGGQVGMGNMMLITYIT